MAVITGLVATLEANTSRFHAAMARAAVDMNRLSRPTLAASQGFRQTRIAMEQLARQALGVSGPVGRLASGLLTFAAGSPLALGVVAGIGAIAVAWRQFTREAREAAEAANKTVRELQELERARLPGAGRLRAELFGEGGPVQQLSEVREQIDRLIARAAAQGFGLTTRQQLIEILRLENAEFQALERRARALERIITLRLEERALLPLERVDLRRLELPAFQLPAEFQLPALRPEMQGQMLGGLAAPARVEALAASVFTVTGSFDSLAGELGPMSQALEIVNEALAEHRQLQDIQAQGLQLLDILERNGIITLEERRAAEQRLGIALEETTRATELAAAGFIQMGSAIATMFIQARSAGGFLGGALGVVGGALFRTNPLAGALLTAGGQIISALDSRQRRDPLPVRVTNARELREDRVPIVNITIRSPEGRTIQEIRDFLRQSEILDAVPRLGPGSVIEVG